MLSTLVVFWRQASGFLSLRAVYLPLEPSGLRLFHHNVILAIIGHERVKRMPGLGWHEADPPYSSLSRSFCVFSVPRPLKALCFASSLRWFSQCIRCFILKGLLWPPSPVVSVKPGPEVRVGTFLFAGSHSSELFSCMNTISGILSVELSRDERQARTLH